jgi:hypothetical protein
MAAGMGGLDRLLSGVAADPELDAVLLLDSADFLLSARDQLTRLLTGLDEQKREPPGYA